MRGLFVVTWFSIIDCPYVPEVFCPFYYMALISYGFPMGTKDYCMYLPF